MTKKASYFLILLLAAMLFGCEKKLKNSWYTAPYTNAFGEETGVSLIIDAERLPKNVTEAKVTLSIVQDLISGGFKEVFTFNVNGVADGSEIEIETPDGDIYFFELYDGMIFNIDYQSNEVAKFIELLNFEYLILRKDELEFTISTAKFLQLYEENFRQQNS